MKVKRPHAVDIANAGLPPELARSRYGKWRALSLLCVYVVMMVHFLHWKVAGRTMAPLELSEIMKALELRVLSAGVIFIGIMIVGSAIFGRFFCSWGCHMLAVQDLSHWILKRLRIRPRAIRSRVLLLVPFLAAAYMFLWPQVKRMWRGYDLPAASMRLTTTNFWRDLPGPLVMTLTFLTCGFLIVYFFGGRGFCTYGCPYGVLFGLFDRIAPGRIRVGPGCVQCGKCTAICTSNVRVHEETRAFGMVVSPRCMKDLDCVSVCPQDALRYGFGRPGVARRERFRPPVARYDFSIPEEAAMVAVFVVALFTWRGLYDRIPFLMSLALSAVTAYLAISFARLFYRRQPTMNRYRLKANGRLRRSGRVFAVSCGVFLLFAAHSTFIQYHRWRGDVLLASARAYGHRRASRASSSNYGVSGVIRPPPGKAGTLIHVGEGEVEPGDSHRVLLERAADHLGICDRYGLVSTVRLKMKLGGAMLELGRSKKAEAYFRDAVRRRPDYPEARIELAESLMRNGRDVSAARELAYVLEIRSPHEEDEPRLRRLQARAHIRLGRLLVEEDRLDLAGRHYGEALRLEPENDEAHFGAALVAARQGRLDDAVAGYRRTTQLNPDAAEAYANLGDVLLARNEPEAAVTEYRRALAVDPQIEKVRFKLGVIGFHTSQYDTALEHFAAAIRQSPDDVELRSYYGLTLEQVGRLDDARVQFERAVAIDDRSAEAHFNLGRMSLLMGDRPAADRHLRRAVQLDPRYAKLLKGPVPSGR